MYVERRTAAASRPYGRLGEGPMAKETLTITDNRTGKQYEVPIEQGGVIRAAQLRDW